MNKKSITLNLLKKIIFNNLLHLIQYYTIIMQMLS